MIACAYFGSATDQACMHIHKYMGVWRHSSTQGACSHTYKKLEHTHMRTKAVFSPT